MGTKEALSGEPRARLSNVRITSNAFFCSQWQPREIADGSTAESSAAGQWRLNTPARQAPFTAQPPQASSAPAACKDIQQGASTWRGAS